jgi:chromosome segregation ATPase
MEKTLTFEQMMALFAEGRKETAELRKSMAERDARADERFAEGRKETAELRKSMAEGFAESRKETAELCASIANLRSSISDLKVVTEKTNARVDETNARLDKAIAKLDKNNAKLDENNAKLDKNNAKLDENTAQMKINSHKMGLNTNKLGKIVESVVIPNIVEKFNEKGFKFDDVNTRVEILNEKEDGNLAELDALLENGKYVIAVEAKTDMEVKDVNDHVKRLNALRVLPRKKKKKIYGAISTAIARKRPVNYALKQGFYVLQQPDVMGVKILDFPKGQSAKAW